MRLGKSLVMLSCLFISACQTVGGFKIQSYNNDGIELQVIQVSPNRIRQQCLFLNAEGDGRWRHQYLMFILSGKSEVLEIADPLNMDKESCQEQIVRIEKILKSESGLKLCARDGLKKKVANVGSWQDTADFDSLGVHKVKYESLTFDSICNSKKCYGDNSAYTYTCPGFVKK